MLLSEVCLVVVFGRCESEQLEHRPRFSPSFPAWFLPQSSSSVVNRCAHVNPSAAKLKCFTVWPLVQQLKFYRTTRLHSQSLQHQSWFTIDGSRLRIVRAARTISEAETSRSDPHIQARTRDPARDKSDKKDGERHDHRRTLAGLRRGCGTLWYSRVPSGPCGGMMM